MQTYKSIYIYRLDQILGKQGSKAKDVYASKISLASRVVKIERQVSYLQLALQFYVCCRQTIYCFLYTFMIFSQHLSYFQVDDIESKLDHLLEMYEEDRRGSRRIASKATGGDGGSSTDGALALRVRPALSDKQCSEPNSPVSRTFEQPPPASAPPLPHKRPMNRGYSDLGTRFMRKKVIVK